FLSFSPYHLSLPSFPTRRSSDLHLMPRLHGKIPFREPLPPHPWSLYFLYALGDKKFPSGPHDRWPTGPMTQAHPPECRQRSAERNVHNYPTRPHCSFFLARRDATRNHKSSEGPNSQATHSAV